MNNVKFRQVLIRNKLDIFVIQFSFVLSVEFISNVQINLFYKSLIESLRMCLFFNAIAGLFSVLFAS